MKKFFIGFLTYLVFIILYFLSADFFNWFTIAGIGPNLFIIFIMFLGLFTGNKFSIIMSLITGVTLDLIIGRTLGVSALIFSLIAFASSYFDKNFSKENEFTIILMTVVMTIVGELLTYFLNVMILETSFEMVAFAKILAIEIFYNVMIVLIFYNLFIKIGTALERQFKQKNILTRYF